MANGEIYEKNLSNASGIGSGDYLRTVNSNNESEKINYTLLAKAIIEQWAGSTLAGSAQTVKSAIDALEGLSLDYTRSLTSSDDCNTLEQGVYVFSQSVPQNAPSGVQYGTLIVVQGQTPSASTVYNFQLLSVSGRGLYYRRKQGVSGDVFANWTKVAKQEDIDSLNSNSTGSGALETQSSWTMLAYSYVRLAKMAFIKIEATSTNTSTSWVTVATGYPAPQRAYYYQIATPQGVCKARLNTSGELALANSQGVNGCKIDTVFSYPLV